MSRVASSRHCVWVSDWFARYVSLENAYSKGSKLYSWLLPTDKIYERSGVADILKICSPICLSPCFQHIHTHTHPVTRLASHCVDANRTSQIYVRTFIAKVEQFMWAISYLFTRTSCALCFTLKFVAIVRIQSYIVPGWGMLTTTELSAPVRFFCFIVFHPNRWSVRRACGCVTSKWAIKGWFFTAVWWQI